jgi:hypothetical protein
MHRKIINVVLGVLAGMFFWYGLCIANTGATGTVLDKHTNNPIANTIVIASMNTNILEHKKYEVIKAKTDNKGKYKLNGLHYNYNYSLSVVKDGYMMAGDRLYVSLSKDNTVIVDHPLYMVKVQPIKGKLIYFNNKPASGITIRTNSGVNITTESNGNFVLPFTLGIVQINIADNNIPEWCKKTFQIDTNYTSDIGDVKLACLYQISNDGKLKVSSSDGRYMDNRDETITDTKTGLMWQANEYANCNWCWQNALDYCSTVRNGGYSNWRLPTVDELKSLIDANNKYTIQGTTIFMHPMFEINPQRTAFFTKTGAGQGDDVWFVYFSWGEARPYTSKLTADIRCVR